MKKNRVIALLTASVLVLGQAIPINASATGTEVVSDIELTSVAEKDYSIEIGDAVYLKDGFDGEAAFTATGAGTAEVVAGDADKGKVLSVSGEKTVSYAFAGNTLKWDGTSVSATLSGEGTETSPYLIKTGADLKLLSDKVKGGETYEGKYIKLINNIDLQNYEWEPIGNADYQFKGNFDGNYNKVINIKRTANSGTADKHFGLFGNMQGTLKNIGVENVEFNAAFTTGGQYVGGLAGIIGGTLDNCYARNVYICNTSTTGSIAQVGGLMGYLRANSTLENSYVVDFKYKAEYTTSNDRIGALCGYIKNNGGKTSVNNCYVAGNYVLEGTFANYYAVACAEKSSNTVSANNYVAHGVETYKTTQTQVEVKYTTVTDAKMKTAATDLGGAFVNDATGLSNKGYPYHAKAVDIPDEARIAFDIDFNTSSSIAFEIVNALGETCVSDSISNEFGVGWHRVGIDMYGGKYDIYVDGEFVKENSATGAIGHANLVLKQQAEKTYFIDNVSVEKDYTEELTAFADELMAEIKKTTDLDNVESNVNLYPSFDDISIEWTTSDDKVMDTDGTIQRRAVKLPVTLTASFDAKSTASVKKASAVMTVSMNVAPKAGATDAEKASDITKYYLTDAFITDESLDAITKDLNTLPTEYEGATITWSSSDTTVVSNDGKVTRPETDADDSEVTLTATVDVNGKTSEAVFELVIPAPLSDTAKLKLAADDITDNKLTNEEINKITKNLTLPKKGLYDTTITWSWASGDETAIDIDGNVTRGEADAFVQLRATFELNGETFDKIFSFNVLMSEQASAEQDLALITTIPEETTTDFELPTVGAKHGSVITWESSDACVKIEDGYAIVTRPANTGMDRTSILTVTVTYGEASVSEYFPVKVLKMPPDAELIASVVSGITWESISPDQKTAVMNNLSLMSDYGNGVVATWTCEPAGYIDQTGVVIRPAFGTADVDVVLKATVGTDDASITPQEVTFPVTIKAFSSFNEAIQKAADELTFSVLSSDPIDCLLNNLYLPTEWRYGSTISWTSDDSEHITVSEADKTGYVTMPEFAAENKPVTLSANIAIDGLSLAKDFYITLAEADGVKEVFNYDYEDFNIGKLSNKGHIKVNNTYIGGFIDVDPTNSENQVLKLYKDSTYTPYADKQAFQFSSLVEKKGLIALKTRMYVETLANNSLGINFQFNTGQEIEFKISKNGTGVSIGNQVFPMGEWFDFEIASDTVARTYTVRVNDQIVKEGNLKYIDTKDTERSLSSILFVYPYGAATGEHIVYLDDTKYYKNVYCRDFLTEASTRFETEFLANHDINSITEDLKIPEISVTEVTIETKSSNPDIITDDGKVTRPLSGDATVNFTATYKSNYGSVRETVFPLVVKGGMSSAEDNAVCLANDLTSAYEHINDNNTINYITEDLSLLSTTANGSVISYSSSDTTVITNDGKVTRPTDADKNVTFTITATRNGVSESKTVTFTVKKTQNTPIVIVPGTTTGGMSKVPTGGGLTTPPSTIVNPTPAPVTPSAVFSDISAHWAKDYIEKMYEAGVVNGNDDGTFAPDQTVTREAFITMLVRALDLELVTDNGVFTDVNENDWFAPFVNTAFQNGIVSGISETEFGITRNISRQDMCVMVYNALKEKLENSETDTAFADDESISDYAKAAVYALKESGIVNGRDNNNFVPSGTATRAEAAKIICSIMEAFVK